jgi:hypothetical protein
MSKQSLHAVTATFQQSLAGQLVWLETAPHWAAAAVYAERIHPLIVEQKRIDPYSTMVQELIEALNDCEPSTCHIAIAKWLAENPVC